MVEQKEPDIVKTKTRGGMAMSVFKEIASQTTAKISTFRSSGSFHIPAAQTRYKQTQYYSGSKGSAWLWQAGVFISSHTPSPDTMHHHLRQHIQHRLHYHLPPRKSGVSCRHGTLSITCLTTRVRKQKTSLASHFNQANLKITYRHNKEARKSKRWAANITPWPNCNKWQGVWLSELRDKRSTSHTLSTKRICN